jgi:hypothetical protein
MQQDQNQESEPVQEQKRYRQCRPLSRDAREQQTQTPHGEDLHTD